jgi:hypothetical protein
MKKPAARRHAHTNSTSMIGMAHVPTIRGRDTEGVPMETSPVNKSEEFVLGLCKRSVLSLWCYNNPRGKEPGKELCDILVVCDPHVIIISVKEVLLKTSDNPSVEFNRWERKAVDASIKQIYGAERWLASASRVVRSDGEPGLALPPKADRKVHRIAVAFGGRDQVPIASGDSGKGFVHVMNETSLSEVLSELDTITDSTDYLAATEAFAAAGGSIIMEGSEADLLGMYLHNGRTFPSAANTMMIVMDDIWRNVQEKPEFKRRREADQESYYWDRLVEALSSPTAKPVGEFGAELSEFEIALRTMARESRFSRRGLGRSLREFLEKARTGKLRARLATALSGVIYVFFYSTDTDDHSFRAAELAARCMIARHEIGKGDTVVGIGVTQYMPGRGSASDLVYMKLPEWTAAHDAEAAKLKADLGFFRNPVKQHVHDDEYPSSTNAD